MGYFLPAPDTQKLIFLWSSSQTFPTCKVIHPFPPDFHPILSHVSLPTPPTIILDISLRGSDTTPNRRLGIHNLPFKLLEDAQLALEIH